MALAATLVHVFFLSLHVAASAAFAMAGPDSGQRPSFLICGPAQAFHAALETAGTEAPDFDGAQPLSCPYCTSAAAAPAALLPELPAEPAYRALANAPLALADLASITPQHGLSLKRSRAPPLAA